MKRVLFCALFIPSIALSQITVTEKPVTIIDVGPLAWSQTIYRNVDGQDTTYSFYFRNTIYREIIDMKHFSLSKSEIKEFGKALEKTLQSDMKAQIWYNHIGLSRTKGLGSFVEIYYDNGIGEIKEKNVRKLIAAIDKQ